MVKVPNSSRSPPGLEWTIFRHLPSLAFLAAALMSIARFAFRIAAALSAGPDAGKDLQTLDYAFIGAGITVLLLFVFVAILCGIVIIAKGPQYTADSYELSDSEYPR